MSYFASQRRQERLLGMHLLTQKPFWHKYRQLLLRKTGLRVPNVIWYNDRCYPSPSLLRTCSSNIISMIDLYTILGLLVLRVSREFKSIRGLLSASSQRGFSTSWVSHSAGYPLPLQLSIASTSGVVTLWTRFVSDVKLESWNQK